MPAHGLSPWAFAAERVLVLARSRGAWAGRRRHECGEAGDKVLWTEQDVGGAIAEGLLELIDDLAGAIDR